MCDISLSILTSLIYQFYFLIYVVMCVFDVVVALDAKKDVFVFVLISPSIFFVYISKYFSLFSPILLICYIPDSR